MTTSQTTTTKPHRQRDNVKPGGSDDMQTPPHALLPLLPFLPTGWTIWEPACGKGNLAQALHARHNEVTASDITSATGRSPYLRMNELDFLRPDCDVVFDAIVTNPPYSCKDAFLKRCYQLGKPFALLLPLTALEGRTRQALYREHGLELIVLNKRINFETPSGKDGGSWFPVGWFTWKLHIGAALTFYEFPPDVVPKSLKRKDAP